MICTRKWEFKLLPNKRGSLSAKLSTPTVASVENVKDGIEIKWKSVPDASKYRLYRYHLKKDIRNKLVPLADTIDSSNSFVDTTVSAEETYTYSIKALDLNNNEMHANLDWIGKKIKYEPIPDSTEPELSKPGF